jgi:hypothetical protein
MPEEQNGTRDTRLDRIERALELMIDDHERFRVDLQQLLTAQVLQKDALEQQAKIVEQHTRQLEAEGKERREKDAALDDRVNNLVSAIGEFIRRLPPQQPA